MIAILQKDIGFPESARCEEEVYGRRFSHRTRNVFCYEIRTKGSKTGALNAGLEGLLHPFLFPQIQFSMAGRLSQRWKCCATQNRTLTLST